MIKLLLGYLMPFWFVIFGLVSENILSVTLPVYYATVGYVMGLVSTITIFLQGD